MKSETTSCAGGHKAGQEGGAGTLAPSTSPASDPATAGPSATKTTEPAWPAHKASLHITHNQHRAYYETVEQAIESGTYDRANFPSDEEIAACIAADSVWDIQWYPDTPVGFYCVCAATWERAFALAKEIEAEDGKRSK